MAAPNVSREHRPFFRFRFQFSVVSRPSCPQFRTLFRSSFRLRPKIPYLIPEFIFLSSSSVFAHSRIVRLFRMSAFSGFQASIREGASSLFGRGPERPQNSLLLWGIPKVAPVQVWGFPRARDCFGTLRPSPEKTTCSFPYRFSGKSRNSGLAPGNRDPNARHFSLTLQPLLFWKRARESPKKARVFLFAEPPKSLEKKGRTHKKAREIGKRKKQGNRKKQGLEGQGFFCILEVLGTRNSGVTAPTTFGAATFGAYRNPKDPAVLKTLRDSELLRRSVFTTPPRFTMP